MIKSLKFLCISSIVLMFGNIDALQSPSVPQNESVTVDNNEQDDTDNAGSFNATQNTFNKTSDESMVETSPNSELKPIIGWNRQFGDSARTIKQWGRWMTYIKMKKPVLMNWINGLKLRIYPGNEVFRSLYVRGVYDPNLNVVANALLPKDGVFIDAGSNMGYFSLLAVNKVGMDGRIYAIEPSTRDFIRLVDNVNINQLNEIISCHKLAFSDKIGNAEITIACEERSGLNSLGLEFGTKGIEKEGKETVETITVDAFVERENIKNVDLLKLDIEGSEFLALTGAKNTVEKFRPALMIGIKKTALEACGCTFEQISDWLKSMRYIAYRLVQNSKEYRLEKVDDLSKANVNVVFCLHESIVPPALHQPERKTTMQELKDTIIDFFTK